MKIAVVLTAFVYGATALSIPTLSTISSAAKNAINATHNINGKTIDLVDSTNQAVGGFVKDTSQSNTLILNDAVDTLGDKTKGGIQIVQDKSNQLLDIVGNIGAPFKWGANLGSKMTNLTADLGKTMTNVGVGSMQLGASAANQALGATVDKVTGISEVIAEKASAINDKTSKLAEAAVDETVSVASNIGKGVGHMIQSLGKGLSSWFNA